MRYIDSNAVHTLCDYASLANALFEYHKDGVDIMEDMFLDQPSLETGLTNHLLNRTAWQRDVALGTKFVTVFPGNNLSSALPAIQGTYLLFDGKTGSPQAVIDGTPLTWYKTAADSALGSKLLSRPDSQSLLMVGAGSMAPALIEAHLSVRPSLKHITIWNRTPERAKQVITSLASKGIEVELCDDLPSGAAKADIISCATMSKDPVIHGEWLSPGTHLDLVGAFTNEMREADDLSIQKSTVFVDSRNRTIGHVGEITTPLATGVLQEEDIVADFFDLAASQHPGRSSDDEITWFKNGGGGHLDLMTARYIISQAEKGM